MKNSQVYFAIYDFASADTITERLGVEPDKVEIKGESRIAGPNNASVEINENAWILTCDVEGSIEEQFNLLLKRLKPAVGAINELVGATIQFSIVHYSEGANLGFCLSHQTLVKVAEIDGASIDADIYYIGE